jgi:hypothetical protein
MRLAAVAYCHNYNTPFRALLAEDFARRSSVRLALAAGTVAIAIRAPSPISCRIARIDF